MINESILIAYATKGGATEMYARLVKETLQSSGRQVDLIDLRRERIRDLTRYDAVVLGTGVRIGRVYRKGKRFLKRADLRGKQLAVFLSSGIAVDDAPLAKRKFLLPILEKRGLDPFLCDAFPGKLPGPGGELEDRTDKAMARQWAERLAVSLNRG